MENLVGRQIRGFGFEGNFHIEMKEYIGKIGVVVHQYENKVRVEFDDATWYYPLHNIERHLIPLEGFKLEGMENLVGRKIRGFEFEVEDGLVFHPKMKYYIGEIGLIYKVCKDIVVVQFKDNDWSYPLDKIQPHLIPLEVFKLGQKVWDMSISEEAGVVVKINNGYENEDNPIRVKFNNANEKYTLDGRINKDYPKTLSSAPYTFLGFSQESIIERGTVVYYRTSEMSSWNIGFYDEFKSNGHYVFQDQKKEGYSHPRKFCQTENPLI